MGPRIISGVSVFRSLRSATLPWSCWQVGANFNDLTVLPNPEIMVNQGNHPKMAARFRLVKYYNLPRYVYIYIYGGLMECIADL